MLDKDLVLPLKSLDVAQYVIFLKQTSSSKSAIDCISAASKWLNSFIPGINKMNDSLNDEFLHKVINSAQRALAKPKNRKKPLTGDLVKDIILNSKLDNLKSLRDTLVPALSYSLLMRYDELSHINCLHISEFENHYQFNIPSSKNDQLRGGRIVYLYKTTEATSVAQILKKYLNLSGLSLSTDHFLICAIRFDPLTKSNVLMNKPISYTCCREIIKEAIKNIGLDASAFSTHSARAGGATDLAPHVSQRELQISGRWNDPRSLGNYVETPLERRLEMSRLLAIKD